MDEHDDYRRIQDERAALISDLRILGAVDLDLVRGVGFAAKSRAVRKAHTGAGSGSYIGDRYGDEYWPDGRKRRH